MSKSSLIPDLSKRPHTMTVQRLIPAAPESIYQAWTERFDLWFAQSGELLMKPEVDAPFFFYNRREWGTHAHYGRFLSLEKNRRVEMTWVTGQGGTDGAETLIQVALEPQSGGTLVTLTHSGFHDQASCQGHLDNWPAALESLEQALGGK